ncbi:tail fiber protein [Ferrovibrio sp.]|uniref:phage tail protein n=1 Tax=Ferrovibrio sp. TaxID=1917215 RepID=UPI001B3F49B4|nr:tail fiber protein [Ferrovibrio sp.]MBP7063926.1 phage tail protein [Ferrovibrio sp.]
MDSYIGEIKLWPIPRLPVGWLWCDGSSLAISSYQALYALLGVRYGGDGRSNFNLPDLRNRVPLHMGTGTGTNGSLPATNYIIGQNGGATSVTLQASQIPTHNHQLFATTSNAIATIPGDTFTLAQSDATVSPYALESATGKAFSFADAALQAAGGNQPHNNIMPSRTLNYIICNQGTFPVRPT